MTPASFVPGGRTTSEGKSIISAPSTGLRRIGVTNCMEVTSLGVYRRWIIVRPLSAAVRCAKSIAARSAGLATRHARSVRRTFFPVKLRKRYVWIYSTHSTVRSWRNGHTCRRHDQRPVRSRGVGSRGTCDRDHGHNRCGTSEAVPRFNVIIAPWFQAAGARDRR